METKEGKTGENAVTNIQLVKGEFTPVEASHIIMNLISEKINFHKIERLQIWEANHNCKTEQIDARIEELENEKLVAKQLISIAKELGAKLKINSSLEVSFTEVSRF